MNLHFRLETLADERAVEELTLRAFWNFGSPICAEPSLIRALHNSPDYIPELSYVAEIEGKICAHVLYSWAKILLPDGQSRRVLSFGPLSVEPMLQSRGIGAQLLHYTFRQAYRLGYEAVCIYGHPDFYPRVGFRPAKEFGITAPDGASFDALMALELRPGALAHCTGKLYESPAFDVPNEEAEQCLKALPDPGPHTYTAVRVLEEQLPESTMEVLSAHKIDLLERFKMFSTREVLSWGISREELKKINQTLKAHGYPCKKG